MSNHTDGHTDRQAGREGGKEREGGCGEGRSEREGGGEAITKERTEGNVRTPGAPAAIKAPICKQTANKRKLKT